MGVDFTPDLAGEYMTCTSGTRPPHKAGRMIYETDTTFVYVSNGTAWNQLSLNYVICTSGARPTGRDGLQIYETDTKLSYVYSTYYGDSTTGWRLIPTLGGGEPVSHYWRGNSTAARTLTIATSVVMIFNAGAAPLNTGTGVVTIPANAGGNYWVHARMSVTGTAVGERFLCELYLNGAAKLRGSDETSRGASDKATMMCSGLMQLDAGDTVDFRIQQVNGTARNTDADPSSLGLAIFQGHRVA